MKLLLFLIPVVVFACLSEKKVDKCKYFYYKNNPKNGIHTEKCIEQIEAKDTLFKFTCYYKGSVLIKETYFTNSFGLYGTQVINQVKYDERGMPFIVRNEINNYQNGLLNGLSIIYLNDSVKHEEVHYVNGKKHGDYILFKPDGSVDLTRAYEYGVASVYAFKFGKLNELILIYVFDAKNNLIKTLNISDTEFLLLKEKASLKKNNSAHFDK